MCEIRDGGRSTSTQPVTQIQVDTAKYTARRLDASGSYDKISTASSDRRRWYGISSMCVVCVCVAENTRESSQSCRAYSQTSRDARDELSADAQASSPTHSNGTVSPNRGGREQSGSLSNVRHFADDPSIKVSSSQSPYNPCLSLANSHQRI